MGNNIDRKLAEEIHNKHKIMGIELDVLFPMTGGYIGKPYDDLLGLHVPEPKDFKYLWRWWARIFINDDPDNNLQDLDNRVAKVLGGTSNDTGKSLFDLGVHVVDVYPPNIQYLPPDSLSVAVNKLAHEAFQEINNLVRIDIIHHVSLSIGDPSKGDINVSIYRDRNNKEDEFTLIESYDELFSSYLSGVDYKDEIANFMQAIPRVKLITRDRIDNVRTLRSDEFKDSLRKSLVKILSHLFIPQRIKLKLLVYRSDASREISGYHADYLKYLLASLILGSIGYMSSRGMGSIVPPRDPSNIIINADGLEDDIRNSYGELLDILFSGASNIDISRLREALGLRTPLRINNMPMVPILHPNYSFVIVKRCTSSQDELSILSKISQTISGNNSLCNRVNSNTRSLNWALCKLMMGAPRKSISSKYPRGLRGHEDCIPRRRRSAISYKMLAYPNIKTILTTGFLSRDIVNRGRRSRCWNNSSLMRELDTLFKSIGQEISRISC